MMIYLVKSILCSGILLGFYWLCLGRHNLSAFSRWYLLGSVVASVLIPLCPLPQNLPPSPLPSTPAVLMVLPPSGQSVVDSPVVALPQEVSASSGPINPLVVIYGVVTLVMLLRLGLMLRALLRRARYQPKQSLEGAVLVLMPEPVHAHSFGSYIFVNEQEYLSGSIAPEILTHELAHVRQRHSWDIVFVECIRALWWFNPFLILYRRAIQLNHEYLADLAVVSQSPSVAAYQLLLLRQTAAASNLALSSQFNYSFIKRRILMMTTNTPKAMKWVLSAAVVPLAASMMWILGEASYAQVPPKAPKAPKAPRSVPTPPDPASAPDPIAPPLPPDPASLPHPIAPPPPPPPPPGLFVTNIPAGAGISEAEMATYTEICEANRNTKGRIDPSLFSTDERAQLDGLFARMTAEQRAKHRVFFMKLSHDEQVPSSTQIEDWKNARKYGLWIDGRKVSNHTLNGYTAADFKHYFVSKLHKNTVNYGKYYFQVDLETSRYFQKRQEDLKANQLIVMQRMTKK